MAAWACLLKRCEKSRLLWTREVLRRWKVLQLISHFLRLRNAKRGKKGLHRRQDGGGKFAKLALTDGWDRTVGMFG